MPLFGCLLAHWLARADAALRDSAEAARGVDTPRTGRKTDDKRNVAQSSRLIQKYKKFKVVVVVVVGSGGLLILIVNYYCNHSCCYTAAIISVMIP